MALSAFDDKSHAPESKDLSVILGKSYQHWEHLVSKLGTRFDPVTQDWTFSGKEWGWGLRVQHKKRTILHLTPCKGHFLAGFALGAKAVAAAQASDLSAAVLEIIDTGRSYAEGKAVRLEIRTRRDTTQVLALADIKMSH
jgi:Protein of unknown function (DUF3788)